MVLVRLLERGPGGLARVQAGWLQWRGLLKVVQAGNGLEKCWRGWDGEGRVLRSSSAECRAATLYWGWQHRGWPS